MEGTFRNLTFSCSQVRKTMHLNTTGIATGVHIGPVSMLQIDTLFVSLKMSANKNAKRASRAKAD